MSVNNRKSDCDEIAALWRRIIHVSIRAADIAHEAAVICQLVVAGQFFNGYRRLRALWRQLLIKELVVLFRGEQY